MGGEQYKSWLWNLVDRSLFTEQKLLPYVSPEGENLVIPTAVTVLTGKVLVGSPVKPPKGGKIYPVLIDSKFYKSGLPKDIAKIVRDEYPFRVPVTL